VKHQLGKRWYSLASLPISYLAPLIVYFVLRPHVTSDTEALAIAWFIPIVWTLGSSLWLRHLEVFALLGVVAYGIALSISIVFGAGALPLKLHHALVAGAVGLVWLVSVAIGRPFFLLFIRRRTKQADQAAQVEIALGDPRFVRRITNLTLLIGIASLADAVLQTAQAIVLSTSTFLSRRPLYTWLPSWGSYWGYSCSCGYAPAGRTKVYKIRVSPSQRHSG
jgi:hypothetical protein